MNEESQLMENLAIAAGADANTLTTAELDLIEQVSRTYRELRKVGRTGCGLYSVS
jgi:predicted aldo/keto reductase-like oxidoreductase